MSYRNDSSDAAIPDGRKRRAQDRPETFSTKLLPGSKAKLHQISIVTNKNYNQIIEECLEMYLEKIESSLDHLSR